MIPTAVALAATSLLAQSAFAADAKLDSDKQKFSYAIGYQFANQLKGDNMDVDADALTQAIKDILAGKESQLTMDQMQAAATSMQKKREEQQMAIAEENKKAGQAFMAKHKTEKGVTELPNGIQYTVIKDGSGKQPAVTDTVKVHYRGTLINNVEFDSSYSRGEPAEFPINQVIKGWQEIVPKMKVGSKWKVVIPSDLAYGPRGAGGAIGPNETLIFEIELLEIKG